MDQVERLIIVPGLGDDLKKISFATANWGALGLETFVVSANWKKPERLEGKLNRLAHLIDEYGRSTKINLLGVSAGGSLVINAFCQNPEKIGKVVCLCARMHLGDETETARDLNGNFVYQQSVLRAQNNLENLGADNRARILTIRPIIDGYVPTTTMVIDSARNKQIFSFGHVPSIYLALTLFRGPIINFLQQNP